MKPRSTNNKQRILIAKELEAVVCANLGPLQHSHPISVQTQKSVLLAVAYYPRCSIEFLSNAVGLERSTTALTLKALEAIGVLIRNRHTQHDIETYINTTRLKELTRP